MRRFPVWFRFRRLTLWGERSPGTAVVARLVRVVAADGKDLEGAATPLLGHCEGEVLGHSLAHGEALWCGEGKRRARTHV